MRNLAPASTIRSSTGSGPNAENSGPITPPAFKTPRAADIQFGQPVHKNEDLVSPFDAQVVHRRAESVGLLLHVGVRVPLLFSVLADPYHRQLVAMTVCDVAVDGFVSVVEGRRRAASRVGRRRPDTNRTRLATES